MSDVLKKRIIPKEPAPDFTPEEYFLWSRISSEMDVSALLGLCPWPQDQALKILAEVMRKGSSVWATASPFTPEFIENDEPSFILDLLTNEESDPALKALDREWRRDVRFRAKLPDFATPFEILELRPEASEHEIKTRYLELSRKYHPDRFFRRELGPYREILNNVFSRIQKAHAALKDPITREAEARKAKGKAAVAKDAPQRKAASDAPRKTMAKLAPELEIWARAEAQYKEGLKLQAQGQYIAALSCFQMALNLNGERAQYQKAIDDVSPLAKRERGLKSYEAAKLAIKANQTEDAFRLAQECLAQVPDHAEAQSLFGRCVMDLGLTSERRRAKEFLLRAKAQLSRDPEPCVSLARYFLEEGDKKSAKREIEEALKRDASNPRALKLREQL